MLKFLKTGSHYRCPTLLWNIEYQNYLLYVTLILYLQIMFQHHIAFFAGGQGQRIYAKFFVTHVNINYFNMMFK